MNTQSGKNETKIYKMNAGPKLRTQKIINNLVRLK